MAMTTSNSIKVKPAPRTVGLFIPVDVAPGTTGPP
jgi:hypothetical protein